MKSLSFRLKLNRPANPKYSPLKPAKHRHCHDDCSINRQKQFQKCERACDFLWTIKTAMNIIEDFAQQF